MVARVIRIAQHAIKYKVGLWYLQTDALQGLDDGVGVLVGLGLAAEIASDGL